MNHKERQLQILNLLNEEKEVSVEDLAKKFNVSASTIRRELKQHEQTGTDYPDPWRRTGTGQ